MVGCRGGCAVLSRWVPAWTKTWEAVRVARVRGEMGVEEVGSAAAGVTVVVVVVREIQQRIEPDESKKIEYGKSSPERWPGNGD